MIAGFGFSSRIQTSLLEQRKTFQVTNGAPLENAPPLVAVTTVALGGFRGILADALWLRASRLQDEGKYFENAQLADWITKLEPRFTEVWAYHAWNMSYNISALFQEPETRWRWIKNGITLLRDEGLVYNPGDPGLYHELGWFYQHKIGNFRDRHHRYYKRELAKEITHILGTGIPDYNTLMKDQVTINQLKTSLKLDILQMKAIDDTYGPLDWRLAESHSLYWASRGLKNAENQTFRSCDTMVYQSMYQHFFTGRLTLIPETEVFYQSPRVDLWEQTAESYRTAIAKHPSTQHIQDAYLNFLTTSAPILRLYGQHKQVDSAFAQIKHRNPSRVPEITSTAWLNRITPKTYNEIPMTELVAYIEGALVTSRDYASQGRTLESIRLENYATRLRENFMKDVGHLRIGQLDLPSIDQIKAGLPPQKNPNFIKTP